MELEREVKLNQLYSKVKSGEMVYQYELSFIPNGLDRDYYYKDLLNVLLEYKKANNLDTTEITSILNGEVERERRIKELELELLKLKGV